MVLLSGTNSVCKPTSFKLRLASNGMCTNSSCLVEHGTIGTMYKIVFFALCTSEQITNFTMEIIGFYSIWQCLCHMAPRLKKYQVYSRIYVQQFCQSLTVRMESGSLGDVAEEKDPPKDPPKELLRLH